MKYERRRARSKLLGNIEDKKTSLLRITMRITAVVLMLAVTGIARGWECSPECNIENGFCEKPGKCRCKPGWQGENCNRCLPFPGCLHGTCERAWQCVCEEGWVGSLCDRDARQCSSRPCASNATCIETGEGGYLCICPPGYTGGNCHLRRGPCLADGSPCQNGGTCMDADGLSTSSSCRCPPGFSGDFCERAAIAAAAVIADSCRPNPCLNGGNCTSLGSAFHCTCHKPFAGADCSLKQQQQQQRPKARPRPPAATGSADNRPLALAPQHYSLPAHTFHKLLRPPERDLLKITLKETVHPRGVLVTHGQLLCFGLLALLTCLVVLGTTGIVFFGRCEAWLANAKYSQLVRQQREHLLREAGGSGQEEQEHSVNIILPEKIRLSSFGRHYTSI